MPVLANAFLSDPGVAVLCKPCGINVKRLSRLALFLAASLQGAQAASPSASLPLAQWKLQSSAKLTEAKANAGKDAGAAFSSRSYRPTGWLNVTVPTTVFAALVKNKTYPDPYFGMNLRSVPGVTYPVGANFSNLPMAPDSPFAVAWWYRTEFRLPRDYSGKTIALHFDGINYRANVWLNGRQVATSEQIAGAWRLYELDISDAVEHGKTNALAIQIFPPSEHDLAITFVDWNPAPPDKNMGIWRPAYITASGPVTLRHAFVDTKLDMVSDSARLAVTVEAHNASKAAVHGTLRGAIESVNFSQPVELGPGETKEIEVTSDQAPQLVFKHPRLWWPAQMGTPNLYHLQLSLDVDGKISDHAATSFGIREITSELRGKSWRQFKVNGKPILIRGGGWATDMMVRHDPRRMEQEIRYAQDMGLNTIRLEGKLEPEDFFEVTDRLGMLVMAGWCCCDHWEKWEDWKPEDHRIAEASQQDQIKRLRSHPSMLVWLNGSDNPPPPDVEKMYISVLNKCKWPNPYVSSATAKPSEVTGESGVKMTGPYEYIAPAYWLLDDKHGGAFGFNTETSPGPAVPPVESLRQMLPKEHLWPLDDWWNFHAGGGEFKDIKVYSTALTNRYGPARNVEEFASKSQAMNYEGIRAMFEAYGRNKYTSTGVIQWMMNNGWPSMIWHLYDFYLRPGGGYFGAKKATEALHPQYSYDDRSVWLISSQYKDAAGLKLAAVVYDLNMQEKFKREATLDAAADSATQAFTLPDIQGLTPTYFLALTLHDAAGKQLATNLYWISTKAEELDWANATWYMTPTKSFADFTALDSLPKVRLEKSVKTVRQSDKVETVVTLKNPGKSIAFFLRLKADHAGQEVLPVLWEDNYFSLLPGEQREVRATHDPRDAGGKLDVSVQGWNVEAQ